MSNPTEIFERVQKVASEVLGVPGWEVTPEANFVDDLGADSLTTVELFVALDEEFGIEIPGDVAEQCATVQSVVDYIPYAPEKEDRGFEEELYKSGTNTTQVVIDILTGKSS